MFSLLFVNKNDKDGYLITFPTICIAIRVSTEFRQHGIPYIFFTSVYSVCHTELPKIPRNSVSRNAAEFRRIPRNFDLHGISHELVVTNRSSKKAVKRTLTRVETKIFVFIFSRKFCENLFLLFAKKSYKNIQK
jgi:hypothetical protein